MTLILQREPTRNGATPGRLSVALGTAAWFTLEDAVREVPGVQVASWKVRGQTAIPAGTYRLDLTPSARFQRVLPLVVGVPGFEGIRIHSGNVIDDTDGCILVGRSQSAAGIGRSREALEALLRLLRADPGPHRITIRNAVIANA